MTNPVNWWEILTDDPERLIEFYSGLFGWQFDKDPRYPYWELQLSESSDEPSTRDGIGGGIGVAGDEYTGTTLYAEVEDVGRILNAAEEMGGEALAGPTEIPGDAVLGSFLDPDENRFGAVSYLEDSEYAVRQSDNTVVWWELATYSTEQLRRFYRGVFRWDEKLDTSVEDYAILRSGEGGIEGGICPPQGGREYLCFYVQVADVEGTIEAARERGGELLFGPETVEDLGEKYALVTDPEDNPIGLFSEF